MIHTLTDDQWRDAKKFADKRTIFDRRQGRKEQIVDKGTGVEKNRIGQWGEDAAAFALGCPLNRRLTKRRDDKPGDIHHSEHGWIEVKTTGRRKYNFPLESLTVDSFIADLGVLVWPTDDPKAWEIVGYVTRNEVQKPDGTRRHAMAGKRATLIVPWEKMHPIEELLQPHTGTATESRSEPPSMRAPREASEPSIARAPSQWSEPTPPVKAPKKGSEPLSRRAPKVESAAAILESTEVDVRAEVREGAERSERAEKHEGADGEVRAGKRKSAVPCERAASGERTVHRERGDWLWYCDGGCGFIGRLFIRTHSDQMLCPRCWQRAGKPPLMRDGKRTEEVVREVEKKMLARGGTDAYRVRAGKT